MVGEDSHLNVTKNLHSFLIYIGTKKPKLFWIDAICINQDDVQERGSQVRLMKQIYQQAKKVTVWLYQPSSTTSAKISSWNVVKKGEDWQLIKLPPWSLRMFYHPWFMRVWILQEIVYARRITVIVQNGGESTRTRPWDEIIDLGIQYLYRDIHDNRNTPVEEHVELSMAMMVSMNGWRTKVESNVFSLTLSELMAVTKYCGAEEPKDKIFALLALASDVDISTFEIDYGHTWIDVCVRLTRHTISQSNTLDILRCIGLAGRTAVEIPLPSWVPDLSSPALLLPIHPYDWPNRSKLASEDRPDVTLMCSDQLLVAKCLKMSDVSTIAPAPMAADPLGRHREMLAVLQQWYQFAKSYPSYADHQR